MAISEFVNAENLERYRPMLATCPFCGGYAVLMVQHEGDDLRVARSYTSKERAAYIECQGCKIRSPLFEKIERDCRNQGQIILAPSVAVSNYWNNRRV